MDTTYGITVFSSGHGPERFARAAQLAREAETAGFETVWTGELYNRSAPVPLTNFALSTDHVRLGTNIAYGVGRSPLMWAAEARDLDEISGGRLTLGLGNGTPGMMRNWHGVDGDAPATRMSEFIDVFRQLWRLDQGAVHHDGRFHTVHLEPTADTLPPIQEHLPLWIAGIGPAMVRLAGRKADGLVGHPMFTGRFVSEYVRPTIAEGAARAGRDPADVAFMGILMCAVTDDEDEGRRQLAYAIAQYCASKVYDPLFALHGWTEQQLQVREAARRRDVDAMIAAVPADAIDAIGVVCRPGELAERVREHASNYDHLCLVGMPWGVTPEQAEEDTRRIIEEMRGSL